MENPLLPVSSTEIRARIAQGKSWRYLVPDAAYRYIAEKGLYGSAVIN
ncbi:MAG: nicotinate-nicotinamide nucleotide adenylyltransferase [Treponema sp.]